MCKFKVGQLVRFSGGVKKVYKICRISIYDMVLLEEYETRKCLRSWYPVDSLDPVTSYQPDLPM